MPHPPTTIPFTTTPGVNVGLPRNATPVQNLELFFTMSIWKWIIDTTNQYAGSVWGECHLGGVPFFATGKTLH